MKLTFFLPETVEKSKQDGYMVDLAAAIKRQVNVPVIAVGRIASGALAEEILVQGKEVRLSAASRKFPEFPR